MSAVRRLVVPPSRLTLHAAGAVRTLRWPSYSRLFVLGDGGHWSVDEDARHLEAAARRGGLSVGPARWARHSSSQAVFHTSHFEALERPWLASSHRLGAAWMHGRPGTAGHPEFDRAFEALRRQPTRFAALQVTHAEMHELVASAGVPADRIHRIPLGIDLDHFPLPLPDTRGAARATFGLPAEAFVVGSFQKDGVGWGSGDEPKLVKGPDVLVDALDRVKRGIPELHVLLTGPARGYVRRGLDERGIPHTHRLLGSRAEVATAYAALDAYVVPARQEGGPKSALESLASGVPLVSTRVGQVPEIVSPGAGALLVEPGDAEALATSLLRVYEDPSLTEAAREEGRATAERYALPALDGSWTALFQQLVSGVVG